MSKSSPRVTSRMKKTVGLQRVALPGIKETMDVAANLRGHPMPRTLSRTCLINTSLWADLPFDRLRACPVPRYGGERKG